jgi:hypothetical protein
LAFFFFSSTFSSSHFLEQRFKPPPPSPRINHLRKTTMTKSSRKHRQRAMRNLRPAGWEAAKFTVRTADEAAGGLFCWKISDHTNMGRALDNMPKMGFVNSAKYMLNHFLIAMFGALL